MYTEECSTILLYALKYELLHTQQFLAGAFVQHNAHQINYTVLRYMKVNIEKHVAKTNEKNWKEVLWWINEELEKRKKKGTHLKDLERLSIYGW